jgi:hypothetical protein
MAKPRFAVRSNTSHRRFSKKQKLLASVLAIIAVVVVLEVTNTTHFFHTPTPATKVVVKKGKPSAKPKKNASAGASTQKTPTAGDRTIGGATDTNGSASASSNASQWTVSKSGNITLKQPLPNTKLQPGDLISGSAKVDRVNFRLIDDRIGVISQGALSVVNGNFSGTLNFTSHASTGRLDVFSTDSQGVELNEVQISVSY